MQNYEKITKNNNCMEVKRHVTVLVDEDYKFWNSLI